MQGKRRKLELCFNELYSSVSIRRKNGKLIAFVYIFYESDQFGRYRLSTISKEDFEYIKVLFTEIPSLLKRAKDTHCLEITRRIQP